MIMKNELLKNWLFASLFAFVVVGCTQDAENIKLPETYPKLVIGSFISPQDTEIVVTITRSNPIFGTHHNNTENMKVKDATVQLSDGSSTIVIPYDSTCECYKITASALPILPAKTYSMNVTTPHNESASANCTVPPSFPTLPEVVFDTIGNDDNDDRITLKWQDIPNESNYYHLKMIELSIINNQGSIDTLQLEAWGTSNDLPTDQNRDGKTISVIFNYWYWWGNNNGGYSRIGFDFYLLNTDVNYNKYMISLRNAGYDDPFTEPAQVYTNVKGGLGIFCAYQKRKLRKL